MAVDLFFDATTRELVLNDGDFSLTQNASTQNGNIILFSHGAFVKTPTLGIGVENIINAPTDKITLEMNRWASQCSADKASLATWNFQVVDPKINSIAINTTIHYD